MSEKLEIRKGGRLIETYWDYDKETEKGEYKEKDVTDEAIRRLFDICELEDGVTLGDIFFLLNTNLETFDGVIGNWCKEIVEEGLTICAVKEEEEDYSEKIDYLELYWHLVEEKEDKKNKLYGYIFPDFHGVGVEQKEDKLNEWGDVECPKGERINYGIAYTPANLLAKYPVKLREEIEIFNENDWKEKPQTFEESVFGLGHILYGIIWELSFFGGPERRDKKLEELNDTVKKACENLKSSDEIFGDDIDELIDGVIDDKGEKEDD